ncbi:MAG TPA: DUF1573 domain-containing protein [Opitutus sp.]|nr:DUF1573 domain-containing protein [Opitutus sp.]
MKRAWLTLVGIWALAAGARAAGLEWDAMEKTYDAKAGEEAARVMFTATNRSKDPVTITEIGTSCPCTGARPPRDPWVIAPGASDELEVLVDLRNRHGALTKTIYVATAAGEQTLMVHVNVPLSPAMRRSMNLDVAFQDRQAVLRGDCATCHVAPAVGKTGPELFLKACLICHGAVHRASFVPDLGIAKEQRDAAFWEKWIREGKDGTLMPAFAKAKGGSLDDAQIESLVKYLVAHLPTAPAKP